MSQFEPLAPTPRDKAVWLQPFPDALLEGAVDRASASEIACTRGRNTTVGSPDGTRDGKRTRKENGRMWTGRRDRHSRRDRLLMLREMRSERLMTSKGLFREPADHGNRWRNPVTVGAFRA